MNSRKEYHDYLRDGLPNLSILGQPNGAEGLGFRVQGGNAEACVPNNNQSGENRMEKNMESALGACEPVFRSCVK